MLLEEGGGGGFKGPQPIFVLVKSIEIGNKNRILFCTVVLEMIAKISIFFNFYFIANLKGYFFYHFHFESGVLHFLHIKVDISLDLKINAVVSINHFVCLSVCL